MKMFDPQNQLLCTISKKKAHWYIKKDLATWINEDEKNAIRLNFQPNKNKNKDKQKQSADDADNNSNSNQFNGESANDALYLQSRKSNQCVCCGSDEHYRRHYAVPYAYRKHFPSKFKSHLSHDVVVLCHKCQLSCERSYQYRMKELEENECSIVDIEPPIFVDQTKYHVRSCALASLRVEGQATQRKDSRVVPSGTILMCRWIAPPCSS